MLSRHHRRLPVAEKQRRLVQFRQTHGPFKDVEDLLAVTGIGEKKLARLRPYLAVLSPEKSGQ